MLRSSKLQHSNTSTGTRIRLTVYGFIFAVTSHMTVRRPVQNCVKLAYIQKCLEGTTSAEGWNNCKLIPPKEHAENIASSFFRHPNHTREMSPKVHDNTTDCCARMTNESINGYAFIRDSVDVIQKGTLLFFARVLMLKSFLTSIICKCECRRRMISIKMTNSARMCQNNCLISLAGGPVWAHWHHLSLRAMAITNYDWRNAAALGWGERMDMDVLSSFYGIHELVYRGTISWAKWQYSSGQTGPSGSGEGKKGTLSLILSLSLSLNKLHTGPPETRLTLMSKIANWEVEALVEELAAARRVKANAN